MQRRNPFAASSSPSLPAPGNPIVVEVVRGNAVESYHEVHAALVDPRGRIIKSWGNPKLELFPRSSIKAIQALGFLLEPKIAEHNLTDAEIVLACASHEGEPRHVEAVRAWLERDGFTEVQLECGTHAPSHRPSAEALMRAGQRSCPLHNNCSGKHAGMLLGAKLKGYSTAGYSNYDHPYQADLRDLYQQFFDLDFTKLKWGIDGCGIPTYSVPLQNLALAMSRLADPSGLGSQIQSAVLRARDAVKREPYFLGGTDSLCSWIVAGTQGKAMVKIGAEGVYGASFPDSGYGLAIKALDGSYRAAELAMAHFVADLKIPYKAIDGADSLDELLTPKLKRWGGEVVGELRLARA